MSQITMKSCSGSSWCFFILCLVLALTKEYGAKAQQLKPPAQDFSRHRLVQPTIYHGRTKRELSSTRDEGATHHPEVTMTVDIDGEEYILDLMLNEDLITDNHIFRYQKNGKTVLHKPKREELNLCQYSGTVRDRPGSSVAVSTCHGVKGVIYDGDMMRYIEPAQGPEIGLQHYIYDHADLNKEFHCGYEGGVTNNTDYDPQLLKKHLEEKEIKRSRINRYKRSTSEKTVQGPYNENKLSRYVELVLVADYAEYLANGEDIQLVHHQLKDVANIINSVYAPLNIFISLVGVVVWSERDEIEIDSDGDVTLTNFLLYRQRLSLEIPNDNAHLLIRRDLQNGVVGKALKGPMCTYNFSGGVASNHSSVIGLVATTIAHEMGHNFGMEHDNEVDCECPDEKCIMSPSSTSVTPVHWSSCSLKSLALAFERGMDYCLRNKPTRLFESPTCGNGFVEPGEQCDCGIRPDPVCSACCDRCTLRANATCAAGTCCDMQTCRPKAAGTVCRSADRECDLPEYCSGHSEFCPDDVFKMDATPCNNNEAYCVRGSCRTHTDQCKLLWGTTGESSPEQCYKGYNVKGTKNGNCGYERVSSAYSACSSRDALCGMLHCRHLNERLEFGMESVATLSAVFINNNGTIIPCRTAMIDLGLSDTDPGLVPDGARCGLDMMCMSQRCVSVASVRAAVAAQASAVCPSLCSGHGICNSQGHCHCEPGFAPPLCALPGPGGSVDSGPATDPSVQRKFMVAMFVIFLGIIPTIVLILFLVHFSRHDVLRWWKKPRKAYVNSILPCTERVCCLPNVFSQLSTFTNNSTSSLRRLFSTRQSKDNLKREFQVDEVTYANIAVVIKQQPAETIKISEPQCSPIKGRVPFLVPYLTEKDGKTTQVKATRKICKDDIKVGEFLRKAPSVPDSVDTQPIKSNSDTSQGFKSKINEVNQANKSQSVEIVTESDKSALIQSQVSQESDLAQSFKLKLKEALANFSQSDKTQSEIDASESMVKTNESSLVNNNCASSEIGKTQPFKTNIQRANVKKTDIFPIIKSEKDSEQENQSTRPEVMNTNKPFKSDLKINITPRFKPNIGPKPNTETNKPHVEIIKTGLKSTTNEMIGQRSRVYSIRESGLYVSGSKDVKVRDFK